MQLYGVLSTRTRTVRGILRGVACESVMHVSGSVPFQSSLRYCTLQYIITICVSDFEACDNPRWQDNLVE